MDTFIKDPADELDYGFDWAPWVEATDTITASTWVVTPVVPLTGLVLEADPAPAVTGGKAIVWLSGGADGTTYEVTNHVTTAQGRIVERSFRVLVMNR